MAGAWRSTPNPI